MNETNPIDRMKQRYQKSTVGKTGNKAEKVSARAGQPRGKSCLSDDFGPKCIVEAYVPLR